MVMETPSPQCVGREFVRQYYTLLHEAPEYLHRFYSHNSSFVHGGVEKPGEEQPPVMGQADIHKKIVSLNFCDCHAKIRQVDSQATVGNAVVVQVTGELSNSGQPMRRFMQTFVLAPQSPKKYYVHNDIFRYQDEVFHDESETDPQEEAVDSEPENADNNSQPETVQDPSVSSYYDTQQPPMSNGNAHMEERPETPEEKVAPEPEKAEEPEPTSEAMFETKPAEKTPEPEPETQASPEAPKPSTWASILQSKGDSGASMSRPEPTKPQPKQEMKPMEGGGSPNAPQPQRTQRPPRERQQRDGSRSGVDGDDFSRRSRYPDSQQLFVGNLPHSISEAELKKYFETYGKVQEVRINRKSVNRDVPNFGFVVFEEAETVQKVLEAKPIMLKGDHRINVEEKKQRSEQGGRPGSGTRPGRGGGMGNIGPGRGGGPPGRGGGRGGLNRENRPDNRGGPPGGRGGFGPRR